jgi:hypothetical protein
LRATHPHFAYAPHAAPQALHNSGRLKWGRAHAAVCPPIRVKM